MNRRYNYFHRLRFISQNGDSPGGTHPVNPKFGKPKLLLFDMIQYDNVGFIFDILKIEIPCFNFILMSPLFCLPFNYVQYSSAVTLFFDNLEVAASYA